MFTVAEWYFECDYNHEIGGFDGVSIIEFNDDMKIVNLKKNFNRRLNTIFRIGKAFVSIIGAYGELYLY